MTLHLAPCSVAAARYACENWHYSRSLPMSKNRFIGVWERDSFIGVVIFSHGANHKMGSPFGLAIGEVVELTRVALTSHQAPVTRILRVAILLLKKANPGIDIIISYADPAQGHTGTIYKAGNWQPLGQSSPSYAYRVNGKLLHKRAFTGKNYGSPKASLPASAVKVPTPGKYRFAYPLTSRGRMLLSRCGGSQEPRGNQPRGGGASPTPPLQPTSEP